MRIARSREPTIGPRAGRAGALLLAAGAGAGCRWRSPRRPRADVGETIIQRCTHGQSLSGFSQQAYRQALKELTADARRVHRLRIADPPGAARRGRARRRRRAGGRRPTAAIAATPAEQQRDRARAERSARRRSSVGGQVIHPGVVHANIASAFSSLPTPLLAILGVPARLPGCCSRAAPSETVSAPTAPTEPAPAPAGLRRRAASAAPQRRAPRAPRPAGARGRTRCGGRRCSIAAIFCFDHLLRQGRPEPRTDDHDGDRAHARRRRRRRRRRAARARRACAPTGCGRRRCCSRSPR